VGSSRVPVVSPAAHVGLIGVATLDLAIDLYLALEVDALIIAARQRSPRHAVLSSRTPGH
jgi:hypothetical protein